MKGLPVMIRVEDFKTVCQPVPIVAESKAPNGGTSYQGNALGVFVKKHNYEAILRQEWGNS